MQKHLTSQKKIFITEVDFYCFCIHFLFITTTMNTLNKMLNFFLRNGNDDKVYPFGNSNNEENADKVKEYFEQHIFKNTSNITEDNITNDNPENRLSEEQVSEDAKKVNDQCKVTVKNNPTDNTYTVKCFGVELRGEVNVNFKPKGTWKDGYREFKFVENDEELMFQTKEDENGNKNPCHVNFTGFKEVEPSKFFGKITRLFTKPLFLGTFTNKNPQIKNPNDNYREGTLVYYAGLAAESSCIIQDKNGVVSSKNGYLEACYFIKNRIFDKNIPLKNLPNEQERKNTKQKTRVKTNKKSDKGNAKITTEKKQGSKNSQTKNQPQDFSNQHQPQDLNKSCDSEKTIGKTQANNHHKSRNKPQDLNTSFTSINTTSTTASDNSSKQGRGGSNKNHLGLINNDQGNNNEHAQNMRDIFYRPEEQGKKQTVQGQTRQ